MHKGVEKNIIHVAQKFWLVYIYIKKYRRGIYHW